MIIIYRTKEFIKHLEEDISQRNFIEKKLYELSTRHSLVDGKNPKCYDRSGGIWVYKFQGTGKNSRLILQDLKIKDQQEYQLIVVRDYISQDKYEPRWRLRVEPIVDQGNYLEHYPLSEIDKREATEYYESILSQPEEDKPELPDELGKWLETFTIDYSFNIYESNNWARNQKKLGNHSGEVFRAIKKIIDGDTVNATKVIGPADRSIWRLEYEQIILIYETLGKTVQADQIILLHSWSPVGNTGEIQILIQEAVDYEPFRDLSIEDFTPQAFAHGAHRGYPSTVFLRDGREAWTNIQATSNKSNLALSSEQVELLGNVSFPIFVNGQAGSGKSEMLMYLFCEMLFYKVAGEFSGDLIFLTENEELLERSHVEVVEKLRFNLRYKEYDIQPDNIKASFHTYQNFLRNHFFDKDDEGFEMFSRDDRYIHFYRFKKLYEDSNISKRILKYYPAEIAWFVINTFIRGYDLATAELTPSEFNKIPRRARSFITEEIYREIYDAVWLGFYKKLLEREGYWDRILVIREIFRKYDSLPDDKKYTVIVCDEAQDFTRLELQFLLKLSSYSSFDLSHQYRPQVPVTFAGDPFQTVNPTGFNLAQLKGLFASELQVTFGIDLDNTDHPFVKDLYSNYRSVPEIVNLANTIQYLRHKYLHLSELNSPQLPKRLSIDSNPKFLRIDKNEEQELFNKLKFHVFIAPCNNGEESEYRNRDSFLSRYHEIGIKSAAKSKGNEYPQVVLYKFGDYFFNEFGRDMLSNLLDGSFDIEQMDQGKRFQLSFFFNKLYVAVTRAMEDLNIIETKEGQTFFWEILKQEQSLSFMTGKRRVVTELNRPGWDIINIDTIYDETGIEKIGEADFQTAYRNATSEMDQGNIHGDSEKMRDAVIWFRKINENGDYNNQILFCEAKAAQFEQEFKKAGDLFRQCRSGNLPDEANPVQLASDNYWLGGHWSELLDLHGDSSNALFNVRNIISRLMLNREFDFQDLIRNAHTIHQALRVDRKYAGLINWLDGYYNQLITLIDIRIESLAGSWGALANALSSYEDLPIDLNKRIAKLYYKDRKFKQAFELWREIGDVEHKEFWEAGVQVSESTYHKIFYLNRLGRKDLIYKDYLEEMLHLDVQSQMLILDILYLESRMGDIVRWAKVLPDLRPVVENLIKTDKTQKRAQLCLEAYMDSQIDHPERGLDIGYLRNIVLLALEFIRKNYNKEFKALSSYYERSEENLAINNKLSRIVNNREGLPSLIQRLFRLTAWLDIRPDSSIPDLEPILLNYLININLLNAESLSVWDVSCILDKVVSKLSLKQNVYTMYPGLLLRRDNLNRHERKVLETRFWCIRFKINQREAKSKDDIVRGLKETYNKFKAFVELQERPDFQNFAWYEMQPEVLNPVELKNMATEEERRFKEVKEKREESLKSTNYKEEGVRPLEQSEAIVKQDKVKGRPRSKIDTHEAKSNQPNILSEFKSTIEKLNNTIQRLELKLDESNEQLKTLRKENTELRSKNDELMDRLFKLMDR